MLAQPATEKAPLSAAEMLQRFDRDGDQKLDAAELAQALATPDAGSNALKFVRVQRDGKGIPQSLETAIVSFSSPDHKLQVDLIGAVHVADQAYFDQLNRRFRDYDAVLYELIAPEGTRVPRGGQKAQHPVGQLQTGLTSLLDLSFQLDQIDYTAKHLVHADLSPEQFAAKMEERGESFVQLLLRMMGQAAAQTGQNNAPSDLEMLFALFAPDRPLRLKRVMAGQFENLEGQMNVLEGPQGSTLISERNKRALEVLRQQVDAGHDRLAIFYGAGHMSDMAARLQADFGLVPGQVDWLEAWNLTGKKDSKQR